MNYKKIKKENYTLHLINTDRFKTVNIVIRFTKKYNKIDNCYYKLLTKVLSLSGTKKYNKISDLSKALESLYGANIGFNFFATSENMVFEANISLLNSKYTDCNIYKEGLSILKEVITNPITSNDTFNEKLFNDEKENLIKAIKNIKDSPENYASIKFDEIFFKNSVYAENNYKNIKLFEDIDNKTLFKKYKELFNEFKIDVLVLGEVEENISDYLDNLLSQFKENTNYNKELYINIKPKNSETKETFFNTQSNLYIGCIINNLTLEERDYKLILYNTILGCMNNSVLFMNVREKNSLCYYIGSTINRFTSSIIINSGINKKNYNKTIEIIKNSLESIKNEKTVKELITNAKKTLEISYNDFYDNPRKIIDYYYINEFTFLPSVEERRKKVLKTTLEEIISLAKKVEIKTIFLLEGSKNEED